MSELADKHPMTIKDELVPRAWKLLKDRGTGYTDAPGYLFEEFRTNELRIIRDEQGIFQVQVVSNDVYHVNSVWEDCFRCNGDGVVLDYKHVLAVQAVELMRQLMILDDLADLADV